jgi:hypothetical protein
LWTDGPGVLPPAKIPQASGLKTRALAKLSDPRFTRAMNAGGCMRSKLIFGAGALLLLLLLIWRIAAAPERPSLVVKFHGYTNDLGWARTALITLSNQSQTPVRLIGAHRIVSEKSACEQMKPVQKMPPEFVIVAPGKAEQIAIDVRSNPCAWKVAFAYMRDEGSLKYRIGQWARKSSSNSLVRWFKKQLPMSWKVQPLRWAESSWNPQ